MFCEHREESKAHGKFDQQRGVVLIDPDWTRGSEAWRAQDLIHRMRKHWFSASVLLTYPIWPDYEQKARKLIRGLKEKDRKLDLITVELYVENDKWTQETADTE